MPDLDVQSDKLLSEIKDTMNKLAFLADALSPEPDYNDSDLIWRNPDYDPEHKSEHLNYYL
ncbi:MAG: hypothetical protein KDK41_15220 [Leptospiraceae bacterium]|nr:hypothetical protein [Leptospiraceae bacterium]